MLLSICFLPSPVVVAEGVVVAPGIKFAEFNLMSVEAIGKEDLPPLDNVLPLAEVEGDDSVLCRDFDALVLKRTR